MAKTPKIAITYRKAMKDDEAAIDEILKSSGLKPRFERYELKDSLMGRVQMTLAAMDGSHVVGMLDGFLEYSLGDEEDEANVSEDVPLDGWCYIELVAVHQDFRGKGVGQGLVRHFAELAAAEGRENLRAFVWVEKKGFEDRLRFFREHCGLEWKIYKSTQPDLGAPISSVLSATTDSA